MWLVIVLIEQKQVADILDQIQLERKGARLTRFHLATIYRDAMIKNQISVMTEFPGHLSDF